MVKFKERMDQYEEITDERRWFVWDAFRRRKDVDLKNIKTKEDLFKEVKKTDDRNLIAFMTDKRTGFDKFFERRFKTKSSGGVRAKPRSWGKQETLLLKQLKKKGYTGSKLVKEFNMKTKFVRTKGSIISKARRVKK